MKTEPSGKANPHLAARRAKKAAFLPARAVAAEGRSYQEIADALGIAKSTVCQWLRDRPLGRAAAKALGTPRMTAKLAARYESLYQRALREWNRSKADRRTETVLTIQPADGSPTTKTTVRTEPRTGNAACLGKAMAAMKAMEGLHCRERSRQEWFEKLKNDAAGNEDGLTRTVKTTTSPSGRKVRTVVTTRSETGRLAALRDAQEALDEKRLALKTRLDADKRGGRGCRRRQFGPRPTRPRKSSRQLPMPARRARRTAVRRQPARSPQFVSTQRFAPAGIRFCRRSPFGNVAERSLPKGWGGSWKAEGERQKAEGERRPPEAGQPARTGIRPAARIGGNPDARTGSGFRSIITS